MSYYQSGLSIVPRKHSTYHHGAETGTVVGIVSGGYFQTELASLNSEIDQLDQAIGQTRNLDSSGYPKQISDERDTWWKGSWIPFLRGWNSFYQEYSTGWKSINFPIATSRLEQLEDYRKRFIDLDGKAKQLFAGTVVETLPAPTAPKSYPSWLDDLMGGLAKGLMGIFKWIVIGGIIFLVFFYLGKRIGVPAPPQFVRART